MLNLGGRHAPQGDRMAEQGVPHQTLGPPKVTSTRIRGTEVSRLRGSEAPGHRGHRGTAAEVRVPGSEGCRRHTPQQDRMAEQGGRLQPLGPPQVSPTCPAPTIRPQGFVAE